MTGFWALNQKINSESDGNEVLVTNSISTQNLNKDLAPKSRFGRITKSLRNVFALIKDNWNNCCTKTSMSSNRSLELIFRKL